MKGVDIAASLVAGFPWIPAHYVPKLQQKRWIAYQGDALLFTQEQVKDGFHCSRLPKLSGFHKDLIKGPDAVCLDSILSGGDVYFMDDFGESLIVTKAGGILERVMEKINWFASKSKGL